MSPRQMLAHMGAGQWLLVSRGPDSQSPFRAPGKPKATPTFNPATAPQSFPGVSFCMDEPGLVKTCSQTVEEAQ